VKTFYDLTKEQQSEAYIFGKMQLKELLPYVIFDYSRGTEQEQVDYWAKEIAENATYDYNGKPYIDGMDVPYSFQGGCV
jgi:hypothetical protein